MWIFGWDKLPKKLHLRGHLAGSHRANLSALWILIANSFMQEPVGYVLRNGRAEMVDFGALVTNPHVWVQWPHVFFSGLTTAVLFHPGHHGLAARAQELKIRPSSPARSRWAPLQPSPARFMVMLVGHTQMQHMVQAQPMKVAAADGPRGHRRPRAALALHHRRHGEPLRCLRYPHSGAIVKHPLVQPGRWRGAGINQLQAEYEQKYGAGNYVPSSC